MSIVVNKTNMHGWQKGESFFITVIVDWLTRIQKIIEKSMHKLRRQSHNNNDNNNLWRRREYNVIMYTNHPRVYIELMKTYVGQ